ncbi:hypothetical protein GCM10007874_71750 [Labrys miyagiensis]|uniref:Uncharacterized protein n=1 Tax=Labrys miyagiensis TaxID=346912 RepID=A0ABQ6CWV2_9HYPH|nr:hypothetical protein [Labrys miyagiensis]GLS24154.1 hypothetical protein GCM10007874_71750 [Labrys miyagiensis]
MVKAALEHPLFKNNTRLQGCLHNDTDHVKFGDTGDYVFAIQMALLTIDKANIDPRELKGQTFQQSTQDAVLSYKRTRKIINASYQASADAIVGRMTIERLDDDLLGHKHSSNPFGPDEPARILGVLSRERPAVTRIVAKSLELLRQLLEATRERNEDPGKLLNFEANNPLVLDALRRFCGMSFTPDIVVIETMARQYEEFQKQLPNLPRDQKGIDFAGFVARFPANVTTAADGSVSVPPAVSDPPAGMFFNPRYRDVDATQTPLFIGMAPATLQLMQLHEMGHFYFDFADGDPRGKSLSIAKKFAQTYEFFSKQAVFRLIAP